MVLIVLAGLWWGLQARATRARVEVAAVLAYGSGPSDFDAPLDPWGQRYHFKAAGSRVIVYSPGPDGCDDMAARDDVVVEVIAGQRDYTLVVARALLLAEFLSSFGCGLVLCLLFDQLTLALEQVWLRLGLGLLVRLALSCAIPVPSGLLDSLDWVVVPERVAVSLSFVFVTVVVWAWLSLRANPPTLDHGSA